MKYLIDTSAWIEALRKNGDLEITEQVKNALLDGSAHWNEMILLELWNGAKGNAEKKYLTELEQEIFKLNINNDTWQRARELAIKSRNKGLTIPSTDLLIYASSQQQHMRLIHKDKHFDALASLIKH